MISSSSSRISNEEQYHDQQVEASDNSSLQLTSIVKSQSIDENFITGECHSAEYANDRSNEMVDEEMNLWSDGNDAVEDILHDESFRRITGASEDESVQSDR